MSSVKIAGIDLSTKSIAISVLGDTVHETHWTEIVSKHKTPADRFTQLLHGFRQALTESWIKDVETFCIEEIGFMANGRTTIDMALVMGAVLGELERRGKIVMQLHVSTIRAKFGLVRSDKKSIQRFVERAIKQKHLPTDNVADAFLVAMYGRSLSS
jgi:Holliday junction resolvasome RuvABC endonuclease subunit